MSKSARVVIIKGNEWHSEAHRARAVLVIVLERERELDVVAALHLELDCEDARMRHDERQPKLAARLDGDGIAGPRQRLLEVKLDKFFVVLLVSHFVEAVELCVARAVVY